MPAAITTGVPPAASTIVRHRSIDEIRCGRDARYCGKRTDTTFETPGSSMVTP